jgi:hypothetical protein
MKSHVLFVLLRILSYEIDCRISFFTQRFYLLMSSIHSAFLLYQINDFLVWQEEALFFLMMNYSGSFFSVFLGHGYLNLKRQENLPSLLCSVGTSYPWGNENTAAQPHATWKRKFCHVQDIILPPVGISILLAFKAADVCHVTTFMLILCNILTVFPTVF